MRGLLVCGIIWLVYADSLAYAQMMSPRTTRFLRNRLDGFNGKLAGSLLDYTANHGEDFRIFSNALQQKRSLYVYLPPNYSPLRSYPLMVWMHGFSHDERNFFDIIPTFDAGIKDGHIPPMIIVAPDGSIARRPAAIRNGSFYVNSKAGRFEDYIMQDVIGFCEQTFPLLPGKNARVLSGASMGGYAAINLGIKHREKVGVAVGIMPPLNSRYRDCRGGYFSDFDPNCYKLDDELRYFSAVAKFRGWYGVMCVPKWRVIEPVFGHGPDAVQRISQENAIEQIERYQLKPGELEMFVGYGKLDEFNIDAQVQSFLYEARRRGIEVTAYENKNGRHDTATGLTFTGVLATWLTQKVPNVYTAESKRSTVSVPNVNGSPQAPVVPPVDRTNGSKPSPVIERLVPTYQQTSWRSLGQSQNP